MSTAERAFSPEISEKPRLYMRHSNLRRGAHMTRWTHRSLPMPQRCRTQCLPTVHVVRRMEFTGKVSPREMPTKPGKIPTTVQMQPYKVSTLHANNKCSALMLTMSVYNWLSNHESDRQRTKCITTHLDALRKRPRSQEEIVQLEARCCA